MTKYFQTRNIDLPMQSVYYSASIVKNAIIIDCELLLCTFMYRNSMLPVSNGSTVVLWLAYLGTEWITYSLHVLCTVTTNKQYIHK